MQLLLFFYTSSGSRRRIITQQQKSWYKTAHRFVFLSLSDQPQARSTPIHPSLASSTESAALLRRDSKPHSNGVRNGTYSRATSSSSSSSSSAHKNPKKLQSNPSINSQRSKGSSKSNSSQIPTEAQDGEAVISHDCLYTFLSLARNLTDTDKHH